MSDKVLFVDFASVIQNTYFELMKLKKTVKTISYFFTLLLVVPTGLIFLNYYFACIILRVEPYYNAKIKKLYIQQPIVFEYSGYSIDNLPKPFIKMINGDIDMIKSLPKKHKLLVDFSLVTKINPYPPLLIEYSKYYSNPYFLSFGYIDNFDTYKQVTLYQGEADTTPSPFIKKVRGNGTHEGDYFIKYQVFLSKCTKRRPLIIDKIGHVFKWKPPAVYPNIDDIEWSTYQGGSYDGFEEIIFTFWATLFQLILLLTFLILRNKKSKRKKKHIINL